MHRLDLFILKGDVEEEDEMIPDREVDFRPCFYKSRSHSLGAGAERQLGETSEYHSSDNLEYEGSKIK
jgi:hypothetical protein